MMKWKAAGNLFFSNWINYCVYQETPYNIENIKIKNVSKFGGSSLSDSGQFSKVKDIVSNEKRDIIVVSAPGKRNIRDFKVTDKLLDIYKYKSQINLLEDSLKEIKKQIKDTRKHLEKTNKQAKDRFEEIALELKLDKNTNTDIDITFDDIYDSDSKDFILSRGEYLNAKLMAKYLDYKFLDAKDLIFLDKDGKLDKEKTYKKIRANIKKGEKVVVPGFYARDNKGRIVTFARGGSDYTGSIIAGALDAEVYENWTDVDGIMTDDPNKNKNAKKYNNLSYTELDEIIDSGARVYQKDAIEPVRDKNITIRVLNTNNPEGSGTEIKD